MSSQAIETKIRMGKIEFLNCLPYYHGLGQAQNQGWDYFESFPTDINQAMQRGEVHLAPVSSLEYLSNPADYILLPDLAIGAQNFAGSVLLLSKKKLETLDRSTIALTHQSLSSVALLKILFKESMGFDMKYEVSEKSVEDMLKSHDACLAIGDDALFFESEAMIYKYDLSHYWWRWTGLPFCFALWAVRRDFAQSYPEEVKKLYLALKANRDKNLEDLDALIEDTCKMRMWETRYSQIYSYLANLRYELDATMIHGLKRFSAHAQRQGFCDILRQPEFAKVK